MKGEDYFSFLLKYGEVFHSSVPPIEEQRALEAWHSVIREEIEGYKAVGYTQGILPGGNGYANRSVRRNALFA